jgi:bifunctional DNA-binding transcriptional regulator/antitoxin component of YhaV-PrlF toxin-antitoxin module
VTVRIPYPVARAFGLEECEPVGIIVQPDGTPLRVSPDGDVDPVLPPGHPHAGIAGDPAARAAP